MCSLSTGGRNKARVNILCFTVIKLALITLIIFHVGVQPRPPTHPPTTPTSAPSEETLYSEPDKKTLPAPPPPLPDTKVR